MDTKALLREFEIRPLKGLGQNFLVDRGVLQRILETAEVGPQDVVLEVGAGLGILTRALAERVRRVIAVEVDQLLVTVLREQLSTFANCEVVLGDILELDIAELVRTADAGPAPRYKVVANIPYYITSAVLRRILEQDHKPELVVLMVQNEVAKRIVAEPGEMSLLSVSVQFYGRPSFIARVPARCFHPIPKVDSAILRIDVHEQLPLPRDSIGPFFDVVRAGFGQRRKQLHNALARGLHLPVERISEPLAWAGIDGRRRAETLSVGEWVALCQALYMPAT